jgi:hypothetical protein
VNPFIRQSTSGRSGFTLFEVSISLAIVTFAVISVMLLLPSGLRAQQMSKYHIIAAAKAMEMVEAFNCVSNGLSATDTEADQPWNVHSNNKNWQPDLESQLSYARFGLYPVPTDIARRLDSEGGEIQDLLNQGGYIYYSQPLANSGMSETMISPATPPNETQKLVIGIVGYPQNNALQTLPQKAWPYYAIYPSPPVVVGVSRSIRFEGRRFPSVKDRLFNPLVNNITADSFYRENNSGWKDSVPWEALDLRAQDVAMGTELYSVGKLFHVYLLEAEKVDQALKNQKTPPPTNYPVRVENKLFAPTGNNQVLKKAEDYVKAVIKWCDRYANANLTARGYWEGKNLADSIFASSNNFMSLSAIDTAFASVAEDRRHLYVLACRLMGHAGPIVLEMINHDPARPNDKTIDGITFNKKSVSIMHENALRLGNLFAACSPYNWGAPRPIQRAIMMDYPLMEYDLSINPYAPSAYPNDPFTQYTYAPADFTGNIFQTTVKAIKWRPTTPEPVINAGVSISYPLTPNATTNYWNKTFTSPYNSTLTARFDPAERCRQIVFWAVDWVSYEDFETAPSAPVDAGRFMKAAPKSITPTPTVPYESHKSSNWLDHHPVSIRNPEKHFLFNSDLSNYATGTVTPNGMSAVGTHGPDSVGGLGNMVNDQDGLTDANSMRRFLGVWGADRNANQRLDRGTVPKSVRLRASLVARFNYYDRRVPAMMR